MIKKILPFVIIILFSKLYAQITQVGVVIEMNANEKGISGVGITIPTVSDFQPTISDNSGVFILHFSEKKPGDKLYNLRFTKPGYEIVNHKILKEGWTLTEKDTLRIYLAKSTVISEARAKYYDIIDQYQIQNYRNVIRKLKVELEKQTITVAEYSRQVDEADVALREAYDQIEYYADLLARVNRDELDSLSRCALLLLESGDVNGAIAVYESQQLLSKLNDKVKLRDQSNEAINYLVTRLKEEVDYRKMAAGKANIERVSEIYKAVVSVDTNNFENVSDFVEFLIQQKDYNNAILWNDKIINNTSSSSELASALQRLGHLKYIQKDFKQAEICLLKGLELDKKLEDHDIQRYWLNASYTMNTLGNLYLDVDDIENAEKYLYESLSLRRNLLKIDSTALPEYATSLNNIAELYRIENQYDKAILCLLETNSIREKLAVENPSLYAYSWANSLNNLAVNYYDKNSYDTAKIYYQKAEEVINQLYNSNPDYYSELYVINLNNLGLLYKQLKQWDNAENAYLKAIAVCKERSIVNPETYNYYAAVILNNMGTFYRKNEKYDKALDYQKQALSLRKDLLNYSSKYIADVAISYYNLGRVYASMDSVAQAKSFYQASDVIYQQLLKENPSIYITNCASMTYEIGAFYHRNLERNVARKYYKRSLALFKQLNKNQSNGYQEVVDLIKSKLREL